VEPPCSGAEHRAAFHALGYRGAVRNVAHHEAAHSVTTALQGLPIGQARVGLTRAGLPNKPPAEDAEAFAKLGHIGLMIGSAVTPAWPRDTFAQTANDMRLIRKCAVTTAAGPMAERRTGFHTAYPYSAFSHREQCYSQLQHLREGMTFEEIHAEAETAIAQAEQVVEAAWTLITAVATTLIEARQIEGLEVCRFILAAIENDPSLRAQLKALRLRGAWAARISPWKGAYYLDPEARS